MVIKREKIEENFHLWLSFTPGDKVENFAIFWYSCNRQKKNIKFRWKTHIIEFFEKLLFGFILFLNGNQKRKIEENFHLWLSFTPVDKVENFAIFWYIAILKKKHKISLKKLKWLSFLKTCYLALILFLNGNKKRKNRWKLPFVIEVHSGSQSGEFRNFLVHCNLQKKT